MEKAKHYNGQLLIIFYRNPALGKVKTRLAADIGEANALGVYLSLVTHTKLTVETLRCDKILFYSDYIDTEDNWPNKIFNKALQQGTELGEKMKNAFEHGFSLGYKSICIIGTDCFELTREIISEAFEKLKSHQVVIGPAKDGGYYLLGMNKLYSELFSNKKWSTDSVTKDTIKDFQRLRLKYYLLKELRDVDTKEDLTEGLKYSLYVKNKKQEEGTWITGGISNQSELKYQRKKLRNYSTSAEATLWIHLKGSQLAGRKFRRQHSMNNYILDFYCPSEKLCIELDGERHFEDEGKRKDEIRTTYLNSLGITVVRFENVEVFENLERVLQTIKSKFKPPKF